MPRLVNLTHMTLQYIDECSKCPSFEQGDCMTPIRIGFLCIYRMFNPNLAFRIDRSKCISAGALRFSGLHKSNNGCRVQRMWHTDLFINKIRRYILTLPIRCMVCLSCSPLPSFMED